MSDSPEHLTGEKFSQQEIIKGFAETLASEEPHDTSQFLKLETLQNKGGIMNSKLLLIQRHGQNWTSLERTFDSKKQN